MIEYYPSPLTRSLITSSDIKPESLIEGGHLGVEQNLLFGGAHRDSSYD